MTKEILEETKYVQGEFRRKKVWQRRVEIRVKVWPGRVKESKSVAKDSQGG